jgi:hypothetical protein
MIRKLQLVCALAIATGLAGCSSFKNPFNGNDDTVLPGDREEVLPPEQQTARDPLVTGKVAGEPGAGAIKENCAPDDLNCLPPVDQEAGPLEEAQ